MSNIFEISNYDTKKILNRSEKEVPKSILDKIERGITIEELESFDYPVFKYKTQITIHGLFPKLNNNVILGYRTLIQNKNLSIGVKWNGIDSKKKNLIESAIRLSPRNELNMLIDSQGCLISNTTYIKNQSEINLCVGKFKPILESIKNLYFGNSRMYLGKSVLGTFVRLEILLNGIYTKNLNEFISSVSNFTTAEEVSQAVAEKLRLQKKESDRLHIEYEKDRLENLKKAKVILQKFIENTKLPIIKEIPKGDFIAFYFAEGYETYEKYIIKGYTNSQGKRVFQFGKQRKNRYDKKEYTLEQGINKRLKSKECSEKLIAEKLLKRTVYLYKTF